MEICKQASAETGESNELPKSIFIREPNEYGWVTRNEAARYIGKSSKTVDRLRKKGILQEVGLEGPIMITQDSLERYLRRPLQQLANDYKMILVPVSLYDNLLLKASHVDAVNAKLSAMLFEYDELKNKYTKLLQPTKDVGKFQLKHKLLQLLTLSKNTSGNNERGST